MANNISTGAIPSDSTLPSLKYVFGVTKNFTNSNQNQYFLNQNDSIQYPFNLMQVKLNFTTTKGDLNGTIALFPQAYDNFFVDVYRGQAANQKVDSSVWFPLYSIGNVIYWYARDTNYRFSIDSINKTVSNDCLYIEIANGLYITGSISINFYLLN